MDRMMSGLEELSGLREDWEVILRALPAEWERKAFELGAYRRKSRMGNASTLLRVMFIHLSDGCSLRQTAVRASEGGLVHVSDVALLKRLRGCGEWFGWMVEHLTNPVGSGAQGLLPGKRLRLVDGTIVHELGPNGGKETWRVHYALDLATLRCDEVHVTPLKDGETLSHYHVRPGDVLIADRGFSHRRGIAYVVSQQGEVLVRLKSNIPLQTPDGKPFELLSKLKQLAYGEIGDWNARIIDGTRPVAVRICAIKKSEMQTRRAQDDLRKMAAKKQHRLRYQTLQAAGYTVVLSTLQDVPAQTLLELYRMRWQIELQFKRLKSLLQLGHLKKTDQRGAKAWLQGKLLIAVLIDRLIAIGDAFSPWGYITIETCPQEVSMARDRADALPDQLCRSSDNDASAQPSTLARNLASTM